MKDIIYGIKTYNDKVQVCIMSFLDFVSFKEFIQVKLMDPPKWKVLLL